MSRISIPYGINVSSIVVGLDAASGPRDSYTRTRPRLKRLGFTWMRHMLWISSSWINEAQAFHICEGLRTLGPSSVSKGMYSSLGARQCTFAAVSGGRVPTSRPLRLKSKAFSTFELHVYIPESMSLTEFACIPYPFRCGREHADICMRVRIIISPENRGAPRLSQRLRLFLAVIRVRLDWIRTNPLAFSHRLRTGTDDSSRGVVHSAGWWYPVYRYSQIGRTCAYPHLLAKRNPRGLLSFAHLPIHWASPSVVIDERSARYILLAVAQWKTWRSWTRRSCVSWLSGYLSTWDHGPFQICHVFASTVIVRLYSISFVELTWILEMHSNGNHQWRRPCLCLIPQSCPVLNNYKALKSYY